MGIMRFNYRSQVLGHYVDVTVVLPTDNLGYYDPNTNPEKARGSLRDKPRMPYKPGMKLQTVYLMHGGGDEDSLTYRYTNAERYAQDNCVMLVTPNVTHSFGADTNYGVAYSTFITEELPVVIRSIFPSSAAREDNFIIGYAMGGNAALGNALIHPELYSMCIDISGGIGYTPRTDLMIEELNSDHFKNGFSLYASTFGKAEEFAGSKNDLGMIAKKLVADKVELPEIIMICGSKEFIRGRVEGDVEEFHKIGIPVKYICPEGYDHDFDTWDKFIRVSFEELLPLKRSPIYPNEA